MKIEAYQDEIHKIVNDLKVSSSDEGSYAAHYTSASTPRTLLQGSDSNLIWQFSCDYMNDPEEGRYLIDLMISAAKKSKNPQNGAFVERLTRLKTTRLLFSAYDTATFISCWTLVKVTPANKEECDSLNHWRFYGDDGRGACIMLPVHHMTKIFPDQLFHVVYGTEGRGGGTGSADRPANRLRDALIKRFDAARITAAGAMEDLDEVLRVTHPLLFLFKSPEYREEQEIRSLIHRKSYSEEEGVKFFSNKADEPGKAYVAGGKGLISDGAIVFFGPKSDHRYAIEAMGMAANLKKGIEVYISSKPYR